jgi:FkbM family methyltransferase
VKRIIKEGRYQEAIFQPLGYLSATVPPALSQCLISSASVDGMRIFFRPLVLGDLQVVFTEYEKHISKIFNPKFCDVVLDVGAYMGYPYTLKSAKLVGSGKVISIEPDPRNFQILAMNVKSNKVNNVILLNVAISDKDGVSSFHVRKSPMVSRMQTCHKSPSDVLETVRVKTRSIDSILEQYNIPKVNRIKIDVEGAEIFVLKGG